MAVPLARRILVYEWRRFLPATISVAFSGILMVVQGALLLGIVSANALYVTQSGADLWIGFPGTQSADLGRSIDPGIAANLYMDPRIGRVEPLLLGNGDWRGARGGGTSVTLVGISPRIDGLGLMNAVPPDLRALLQEPGAVLVDESDLDKLVTDVGQKAEINGHLVRVVGATRNLRAMGGVNVVASLSTVRMLDPTLAASDSVTYYLAKTVEPRYIAAVHEDLAAISRSNRFEVWTASDLASRSVRYWLLESGAGIGFVFATIIAMLVGTLITSQTLMGAVAASITQYATLRALGVSSPALRRIVIEQSGWVAAAGLTIGLVCSLLTAVLAKLNKIPFELRASMMVFSAAVVLSVALVAGLLALRRLRHADPAALLR
ncbi:ABC transporter permease [Segnochrobactrum spirostomi]|uniref:FtsX-like permease family protein n=1 Tax=Segnochrobactrum spirostomi TaxID=2608987 RepID=A0A6A7Y913_9HYPH|nr:ABC transporter permease [Segnochrobactrum spirostomi]MQT14847.1 FtsX-like permease family protein [Segnochrobactrum spirostomi]